MAISSENWVLNLKELNLFSTPVCSSRTVFRSYWFRSYVIWANLGIFLYWLIYEAYSAINFKEYNYLQVILNET